ncbi:hypothetical protein J437_LFUL010637 [Ladona fulva]|uniref:Hook C-terminal domain-containing protein n=1 Tax=Ladona fulva TaxID=123851 RepID=A0A8K0KR00_LADFU|nr:hypothetical protein J437_LFUL010637 [Ladona fulva]
MQEKLQYLQREKERLIIERDSLKEVNEELKCTQLQMNNQKCGPDGDVVDSPETITEAESVEIVPPKIKEKILRLQHENKMLKMNPRGPDEEQAPALRAMIEDMDQHLKTLQTENRSVVIIDLYCISTCRSSI